MKTRILFLVKLGRENTGKHNTNYAYNTIDTKLPLSHNQKMKNKYMYMWSYCDEIKTKIAK